MLPTGITKTVVTFGTALTNVTRTDLLMRVTFTPTTNLVWAATGTVIIGIGEAATSTAVPQGAIELIDPWQDGFVDGNGNQITNWGYRVKAEYVSATTNQVVLSPPEKIITWSSSTTGPIDLDLLVPVPAASGIVVYLPDTWTGSIASLNLRVNALEAGGGGGGTGGAVSSVAGRTGAVVLSRADVGLSSVDNTSDLSKPVSTAQQTAIGNASTADRARANHSGTQPASTISDFTEAAQDAAAALLAAGTHSGVTFTYDDAGNRLGATVANLPPSAIAGLVEFIQDTVAAFLIAGTGTSLVYDDAANTLTITTGSTGGGGSTSSYILAENGNRMTTEAGDLILITA